MGYIADFFNAYMRFFASFAGGDFTGTIIATGIGWIVFIAISIVIAGLIVKLVFGGLKIKDVKLPKSVVIIFILALVYCYFHFWVI